MREPGLDAILFEKIQICAHHVYLGILFVFVTENAVFVSAVVMVCELAATGLVEVFGPAAFGVFGRAMVRFLFSTEAGFEEGF